MKTAIHLELNKMDTNGVSKYKRQFGPGALENQNSLRDPVSMLSDSQNPRNLSKLESGLPASNNPGSRAA